MLVRLQPKGDFHVARLAILRVLRIVEPRAVDDVARPWRINAGVVAVTLGLQGPRQLDRVGQLGGEPALLDTDVVRVQAKPPLAGQVERGSAATRPSSRCGQAQDATCRRKSGGQSPASEQPGCSG